MQQKPAALAISKQAKLTWANSIQFDFFIKKQLFDWALTETNFIFGWSLMIVIALHLKASLLNLR